jgi:sigma-B regulation protein RsbU (phosphoserine phosphatase)
MLRSIKIGTKILVVVLLVSLSSLLLISVISYMQMLNLTKYSQDANIQLGATASNRSKTALISQAEFYLKSIAQKQAEGTNSIFTQIRIAIMALSEYVERVYASPERFTGMPVPFVSAAPDKIACSKYMYAPGITETAALRQELNWVSNAGYIFSGMLANNTLMDNIYLGTESGISYRYSYSNDYIATYDPRARVWYKAAMEKQGEPVWIDTYVDSYGNITVTCARAFKNKTGVFAGVVATDIMVTEIVEYILALDIGTSGYAFLLDGEGAYIAHPRYGEEEFNLNPLETAEGAWRMALQNMLNGINVGEIVTMDGEDRYLASTPITETGWVLGVCVPIQEVIAPAEAAKAEITEFTDTAQMYIRSTLSQILMHFIIIFAVLSILVVAFSYILSTNITKPIEELTELVNGIGRGELDHSVTVRGKDEITELERAFNKMTEDIKEQIHDIQNKKAGT